jgi:hypothetical protein
VFAERSRIVLINDEVHTYSVAISLVVFHKSQFRNPKYLQGKQMFTATRLQWLVFINQKSSITIQKSEIFVYYCH